MASILSAVSPSGDRVEYVVSGNSRGDVEAGMAGVRRANPNCAVSFRAPFLEGGVFKAHGWVDRYQEDTA